MEIITVDSPKAGLLRRRSQPVRAVTPDVRALMDQMFEMLQVAHGLGLAAPQIGVGRRVFVAKIADRQIALADPEILHQEGEVVATEACLSIPGLLGDVPRAQRVTVVASQYGLEVLQPASLKAPEHLARLRELKPDLVVVVAFGRIVPPEVLAVAPMGGINFHPSLLPRYRGAAPIPRAIAAGDTETGVTVIHLTQDLDAGDIILQRAVPIRPDDATATLEPRLAR